MFAVASFVTRRPAFIVVAAALLALVALAFGANVARHLAPFGFDDPATQSVQARAAVERAAGYDPDLTLTAVVSPFTRANVERAAWKLRAEPTVARVLTVYSTGDRAMVSRDGRSTYVLALFKPLDDRVRDRAARRIEQRFADDTTVLLGGGVIAFEQVGRTVEQDLLRAEEIAFPLLLVLSFWVFRGLVAALLPPLVGALTILVSFLGLRLATGVTSLSVFALNLVTGMGLGLSIDWSLLVVSRFREELVAGEGAVTRTVASAGRTVVFSSLTVAAAMASLLVFPQRFLFSMGVGGVLVSLVGGLVALLVLPAVLALLGPRVNALAPARWQRAAGVDDGRWYGLARFVMRHAALVATASTAFLIVLGLPFLRVAFTAADARVLPESASGRRVYEKLAADFPRATVPFYVVLRGRRADADAFSREVAGLPSRPHVLPPRELAPDVWKLDVYAGQDYLSRASQQLVHDVRALPTPLEVEVEVGGGSASFVDEKSSLAAHLPTAILLVVVTTLIVLFLMTGSVILPLKALVMNALTVSAAFGFLVFVFQDGRLRELLRYPAATGIDFTQPILLFAVAFALSTDYGVFLLSRIKEFHDAGEPNDEAVAHGLQRTGRIITAAALLFCAAVWTFATSRIVFVKQLGTGIGVAVLVDATIVRALLVPSLMKLLGDWNWWAPRPLRRLHRRLGLSETS